MCARLFINASQFLYNCTMCVLCTHTKQVVVLKTNSYKFDQNEIKKKFLSFMLLCFIFYLYLLFVLDIID